MDISKSPMPKLAWAGSMMFHGFNILYWYLVNLSFSNSNNSISINVLVLWPQVCLILHEYDSESFILKDINKEYVVIHSRDINSLIHM